MGRYPSGAGYIMVLVRAWVKGELEGILQVGMNSPPVASRRFRSTRRQHVQCVEVDERSCGLKINDGETMVWCFVTKQGMDKVIHVGGIAPFCFPCVFGMLVC